VKVRCPECHYEVNAPRDVLSEHKRKGRFSWESVRCAGSGLPALSIAIAQAEREVTNIRTRIAATQALIAEYELSVADLSSDLAKSEATLAKLRKRAAKDGAK
jgi:hypothetical protein